MTTDYVLNCYFLENGTVASTLSSARYIAQALILYETKLWITGGNYNSSFTSEYVTPGQEAVEGPRLPARLQGHCMVQLDQDTIMFLGLGFNDEGSSSKTYLYSIKNDSFTMGPELTSPRSSMMCGVLEDDQGNNIVVAAGGYDYNLTTKVDEVQTWLPGSGKDFMSSGHLPLALSSSSTVTTSDKKSLIIIGGQLKNISVTEADSLYKIPCSSNNCNVQTMPQKLKVARSFPVAMLIPDSKANCN